MASTDSKRDRLIEALSGDVRLMTHHQLARLLESDAEQTENLVAELLADKLIAIESHLASIPEEGGPALCWSPGDSPPDFGNLAYQFRKRVREASECEVILPTAKLCKVYGGTRVRPRASEWSHDVRLANAYLSYRDDLHGSRELSWTSGDTLRSDGETHHFPSRVPDAILRKGDGTPVKVIEAAGSGYSRSKLTRLHASYSSHPYELW